MHISRTAVQFVAEPTCKCAMQPHVHQDDPELDPQSMSRTKTKKQINKQAKNKLMPCITQNSVC